jgi:hypothetical protein
MEKQGTNDLIRLIDQSGLEKGKTVQLGEQMSKFFNLASEWDDKIEQIVVTDPTQTREMKVARETRLMLRQYRLDAQKLIKQNRDILKEQMSDQILLDKLYLNAGKMITATFENLETKLEQKEKFAERWENEQRAILRSERLSKLQPFTNDASIYPVETMTEIQFNELLNGIKSQFEHQERENERIAKERAEMEFQNELIRRQNELLKAGFIWTGYVFKFETLEITPDRIKEMKTIDFNNELFETKQLIAEIQKKKIESVSVKIENAPEQPDPTKHFNTIAQPIKYNSENDKDPDQKTNYLNLIKGLKFECFGGNMPLDLDLVDKFNGFKNWAIKRIENEYK